MAGKLNRQNIVEPLRARLDLYRSNKQSFGELYLVVALVVLAATTVFWGILSAKVQQSNSDQLIQPLLFQHLNTLRHAYLPGQHTFLLKWPLFILIGLIGPAFGWIALFTVLLCVLTVGLFAYILYRIDRRPWVFGTLCLALSSVLIVIPAEPYAGALLPANFAMLATRNIEYIILIVAIVLVIKLKKFRSWNVLIGLALMTILFASDKLLLDISVAAALLCLVVYALLKSWNIVSLSVNWLVVAIAGGVLSVGLLELVNATGLVHVSGVLSSSPYGFVTSAHSIVLGCIYAVLGLLANLGANPASNYTVLKHIPSQIFHGLLGPGLVIYIVNLALVVVAIYAGYNVVKSTLTTKRNKSFPVSTSLSLTLIALSAASVVLFIFSNHYYPVDSRYMLIVLFAAFVSMATYLRTKDFKYEQLAIVGAIIFIGIIFGIFRAISTYHSENTALTQDNNKGQLIAQFLKQRPDDELLGNYWDVVQVKYDNPSVNIVPLVGCAQPGNLSSSSWQVNLRDHSFAYLLALNNSETNFPSCSVQQIIAAYGKPHQSVLISGSLAQPNQLLLLYPHGTTLKISSPNKKVPSTVLPISLGDLQSNMDTSCNGPTLMTFVAHEDDDLLFMNPDLQKAIDSGECIRTVYLTAGDGGNGAFFWLSREAGSEAAYSYMTGATTDWVQRLIEINNHEFVTIASPYKDSKVSLIFMHLPDGNLKGQGFPTTGFQSLAKLESGDIKTIHSVDNQSYYSLSDLNSALANLMRVYNPAQINTQANYISSQYPDHSDHIAVGNVVKTAYAQYDKQQFGGQVSVPIHYYIGYPIHSFPDNVSGAALAKKEQTFFIYAKHDPTVCQNIQACSYKSAYSSYLPKQYQYGS